MLESGPVSVQLVAAGLTVTVTPSSLVMPARLSGPVVVAVYDAVASVPAAKTAVLSVLLHATGVPVPSASGFQLAAVVFQAPAGLVAPVPSALPLVGSQ